VTCFGVTIGSSKHEARLRSKTSATSPRRVSVGPSKFTSSNTVMPAAPPCLCWPLDTLPPRARATAASAQRRAVDGACDMRPRWFNCRRPCVASAGAARSPGTWSPARAGRSDALVSVGDRRSWPRMVGRLQELWPALPQPAFRPSRDSNACTCGPSRKDTARCGLAADSSWQSYTASVPYRGGESGHLVIWSSRH
jgi:hypothetical protein